MSLVGLGWKTSAKTVYTVSKIIPLRLRITEIMRELLAVFMSTKDPENELFYRSQGNAARVRKLTALGYVHLSREQKVLPTVLTSVPT
jgi:hypothetical protein